MTARTSGHMKPGEPKFADAVRLTESFVDMPRKPAKRAPARKPATPTKTAARTKRYLGKDSRPEPVCPLAAGAVVLQPIPDPDPADVRNVDLSLQFCGLPIIRRGNVWPARLITSPGILARMPLGS